MATKPWLAVAACLCLVIFGGTGIGLIIYANTKARSTAPVKADFDPWTGWTACNLACGGGNQTRARKCAKAACTGSTSESRTCNTHGCPVNGYWKDWSKWDKCSVTCGSGARSRTRECVEPKYQGQACEGAATESEPCTEDPCPATDGKWKPWNDWGACSKSCDDGSQSRNRECVEPTNGGKPCEGNPSESRTCGSEPCPVPVDGYWNAWNDWAPVACPVTCGGDTQSRTRTCVEPLHGGKPCQGDATESKSCGTDPCPVDGYWNEWDDWIVCSVTCGGGTQTRSRTCVDPLHGGEPCQGDTTESKPCGIDPCPVDGYWNPWNDWIDCPVTCGDGSQSRLRSCVEPQHGGKPCEGDEIESKDCDTDPCPVDGYWNAWNDWPACSAACGGGSHSRNRVCVEPLHGGEPCQGEPTESKDCGTDPCPVNGYWKAWGDWSECPVACGGGKLSRSRECVEPLHGGEPCQGDETESQLCNTDRCSVDGYWYPWNDWSTCPVTCGGGTHSRNRECVEPLHGGDPCEGVPEETESCATDPCPVDGSWKAWTEWTACPVTCGGETQSRDRECVDPLHGGKPCEGDPTETKSCAQDPCPVDGYWNPWSNWIACPVTCGGGTRSRIRSCVEPLHGGDPCEGVPSESESCATNPCPVDGLWKAWTEWTTCPVTCGGDTQSRARECVEPLHGGQPCQGDPDETKSCATDPCPVDGYWNAWSNWLACPVTCGGDTRSRTRTCVDPLHGGQPCQGDSSESVECGTDHCPVNGIWGTWTEWGSCHYNVDTSTAWQKITRECNDPAPDHGGNDCTGDSVLSTRDCCSEEATDTTGPADSTVAAGSLEECRTKCRESPTCLATVFIDGTQCALKSVVGSRTFNQQGRIFSPRYCASEMPQPLIFCKEHQELSESCTPVASIASASSGWRNIFQPESILIDECESYPSGATPNYFVTEDAVLNAQITIDYGCEHYVDAFVLKNTHNERYADRGTRTYKVEVSSDGSNWIKAVEDVLPRVLNTDCSVPNPKHYLEIRRRLRYARVVMINYHGLGPGLSYFGPQPVCLPDPEITASDFELVSSNALQIPNCKLFENRGMPTEDGAKSIVVDLQCYPVYIEAVEMKNAVDTGVDRGTKEFTIYTSADGTAWVEALSDTLSDSRGLDPVSAPEQSFNLGVCARFVKITQKSYYGYGGAITYLKVKSKHSVEADGTSLCQPAIRNVIVERERVPLDLLDVPGQDIPLGWTAIAPSGEFLNCFMEYMNGVLVCETNVGKCYHHRYAGTGWYELPGTIPLPTGQVACGAINNKLWVTGGATNPPDWGPGRKETRWFSDGVWTLGTDMPKGFRCHGSVVLNSNQVLIAGGYVSSNEKDSKDTRIYNVAEDTYDRKADMHIGTACPKLGLIENNNGEQLVISAGGYRDSAGGSINDCTKYNVAQNTWTDCANTFPVSLSAFTPLYVHDELRFLGGNAAHNHFRYDVDSDSIEELEPFSWAASNTPIARVSYLSREYEL